MKSKWLGTILPAVILALSFPADSLAKKTRVFIGTYTGGDSQGMAVPRGQNWPPRRQILASWNFIPTANLSTPQVDRVFPTTAVAQRLPRLRSSRPAI